MKKKNALFIAIMIVITSIILTACSDSNKKSTVNKKNEHSSYDPFDLGNENNNSIEFGFGPVIPTDELTYTGKPIGKDYYYSNTGDVDCKLGFMIFVDGMVQTYRIKGENKDETLHQFSVPQKTKIQFNVSFRPVAGRIGEKLGLYVATILNPTYKPSSALPVFGNNHALSQVLPVTLKYSQSVSDPKPKIYNSYTFETVNDKIKKEFLSITKDKKSYVSSGSHLFHLKYKGNYKDSKIKLKKSQNLILTLEGLCDPDDAKYRTTIFIDNKPVKTSDGQECLDMQLKKGMLSKQCFSVDIDGLEGKHILSTISVPTGNSYTKPSNSVVQSDCKLLVIGE